MVVKITTILTPLPSIFDHLTDATGGGLPCKPISALYRPPGAISNQTRRGSKGLAPGAPTEFLRSRSAPVRNSCSASLGINAYTLAMRKCAVDSAAACSLRRNGKRVRGAADCAVLVFDLRGNSLGAAVAVSELHRESGRGKPFTEGARNARGLRLTRPVRLSPTLTVGEDIPLVSLSLFIPYSLPYRASRRRFWFSD